MFDIGMLEIMVILVIALLVIGPERMPEVARKIGQFVGKTKRFVHSVRESSELNDTVREIQTSMNLDQERKELEDISRSMHKDFSDFEKDLGEHEQITRPFGDIEEVTPSQFNRAPAQPKPPQAEEPAESQSSQAGAPASEQTTDSGSQPTQTASSERAQTETETKQAHS
ncbi:Sec-independent protein translocase protein TatB [Thiomicrospira sp. WB1]|uniref:Sec-independent protein translocase protein TatB n=1 Tax=Thiomicrospira sp. WB1 TaxID=1685380 RepID=UPI000749753D|nr:Sec-independent protein translocase protein TatB [Thiomicrospira sp. WB1]KUJ72629.1 preprotein translocase subunit TatB [Thiomicrospira sp. WB1]